MQQENTESIYKQAYVFTLVNLVNSVIFFGVKPRGLPRGKSDKQEGDNENKQEDGEEYEQPATTDFDREDWLISDEDDEFTVYSFTDDDIVGEQSIETFAEEKQDTSVEALTSITTSIEKVSTETDSNVIITVKITVPQK